MKIISHRGNLMGKSDYENDPKQIKACLSLGIDCEIDLWVKDNKYWLGHDEPKYEIKRSFLQQPGLWIHCKNLEALEKAPPKTNYFWHQTDDFTLTSKGYIWTFPGKNVGKKSVIVDNSEDWDTNSYNCFAICTDYVLKK
tara:strand:+ start:3848 stop:4267 length:420 start_codon:yes stop_codon:yes gene_type:complete